MAFTLSRIQLVELLTSAIHAEIGVEVETNSVSRLIPRLREVMAEDPDLADLSLLQNGDKLFIIKRRTVNAEGR